MPILTEERRDAAPLGRGDSQKSYQPEVWGPRHEIVARLHGVGLSNKEISRITGLSEPRVSVIINDSRATPAIKDTLDAHKEQIENLHGRIKSLGPAALDKIEEQMRTSEDEKIAQRAAFGILDRAGYTPVQKQIILGASIPEDALSSMLDALRASDEADRYQYSTAPTPPVSEGGQLLTESGRRPEEEAA